MASISTTSYVLDSRQRVVGTTIPVATYNLAALGSPVEAGTYEVSSFNSKNSVYNVDATNNLIFFDEAAAELGPVTIPSGYYATPAALAAAVKIVMDVASATTYTIVYSALTNTFLFTPAAGTFAFNWATNIAAAIANVQLGFSPLDGAAAATQTSDAGVDMDPHDNLLVRITEDALQNVILVDGTEFSLIVPLNAAYDAEIDGLKMQTFDQTVQFVNPMNNLNVSLFLQDGTVLPVVNASPYTLILRRLF